MICYLVKVVVTSGTCTVYYKHMYMVQPVFEQTTARLQKHQSCRLKVCLSNGRGFKTPKERKLLHILTLHTLPCSYTTSRPLLEYRWVWKVLRYFFSNAAMACILWRSPCPPTQHVYRIINPIKGCKFLVWVQCHKYKGGKASHFVEIFCSNIFFKTC